MRRLSNPVVPVLRSMGWFLFLVIMVGFFYACSEKKDTASSKAAPAAVVASEESGDADAEEGMDEGMDEEGEYEADYEDVETVEDLGTECRDHRYKIPSGSVETLTFSRVYKENANETPSNFTEDLKDLEGTEVHVSLNGVDYNTITRTYPTWVLDFSMYLEDIRAEIERQQKIGMTVGVIAAQQIGNYPNSVTIETDYSTGRAVITQLGGAKTAKAVGALSRADVARGLGLDDEFTNPRFHEKFLGKEVTTPIVEGSAEENLVLQEYSVTVTTPDSGGKRDTITRNAQFLPEPAGRSISVGVTSSWGSPPDGNALFFIISGPAEEEECFEPVD